MAFAERFQKLSHAPQLCSIFLKALLCVSSFSGSNLLLGQTCDSQPAYLDPSISMSFNGMSGFETETEERCFADVLPAGQTHAIAKYWLALSDDTGLAALQYYTLKVRVNGGTFRTIANHKLVSEIDFLGVTPDCVPSVNSSGEVCLYEKQFETVVDLPASTGNTPMQIEVVIAVSTSDQSKSEGLILDGSIHNNFRMVIEQVNPLFIPRDASDAAAKCDVAANTGHCYPTISSRILRRSPLNSEALISGRIRFRLEFDKPHLIGNSSNNGTETTPDYEVNPGNDPNANGLGSAQELSEFKASGGLQPDGSFMVETIGEDLIGATVKITSRDFGGRARVYSEIVLSDGTVVPSDLVVDENNNEVAKPACLSQSEFKFATLPLDQDCDEIADAWERPPTATVAPGVGPIANADDDSEPGPGGPHVGDGYTAHNEYRGFHYIQTLPSQATEVVWTRTDPKEAKDVFFWDADPFNMSAYVASILGNQGANLKIREVNSGQANSLSRTDVAVPWVDPLAKNSSHDSPRQSFALVYKSGPVGSGFSPTLTANSNGFTMSGKPIVYDSSKIADFYITNMGFFPDFIYPFVFAHEAGHQFGLYHPERQNCGKGLSCSYVAPPAPMTLLTMSQFTDDALDTKKLYLKIKYYSDPNQPTIRSWPEHAGVIMFGGRALDGVVTPGPAQSNLENIDLISFGPYNPFAGPTNPITPATIVRVFEQIDSIMDWTPSLLHVNASAIKFSAEQKTNICVHGACSQ